MNCENCEKIIARYLVGDLPPWSRIAVVRHLDKCPPCQKVVDSHYGVAVLLDCIPADEPPSGLWNRISNEIADETPGRQHISHPRQDWRPSALVAAAGLTAGIFLGQVFGRQSLQDPSYGASFAATSPRIATFVQQHSRMAANDPFADQVSLAAYEMVAFRENERMEGHAHSEQREIHTVR